jgi:hypothetical protein
MGNIVSLRAKRVLSPKREANTPPPPKRTLIPKKASTAPKMLSENYLPKRKVSPIHQESKDSKAHLVYQERSQSAKSAKAQFVTEEGSYCGQNTTKECPVFEERDKHIQQIKAQLVADCTKRREKEEISEKALQ